MKTLLPFSLFVIFTAASMAQTNRGGISGTVTDKSSAVVADAEVTVTNMGTNEFYHARTSKQGSYSVSNLDPVVYKVEVEVPGFRKAVVENVKVDTAAIQTVDITLELGNVATEVEVTEQAPLLNTENGTLTQTISERLLTDVPLANRSVLDLAVVTPNVSGDVGSEDPSFRQLTPVPGFNISVNGGRPGSTYMIADGVSNTGVGLAREVVSFSPETVQELTVQTSAYSAAFGHSGGGIINITTKSGTNAYHGSATAYHRNPATNAAPWTNAAANRPTNQLRYTQMSFTLGGPVVIPKIYNGHNRTFFFGAIEPRYQSDVSQGTGLLPTDAMRQGDFSGLVGVNGGLVPASVLSQFPAAVQARLVTNVDTTIYRQFSAAVDANGKPQLVAIPLTFASTGCGTASAPAYCPFPGNKIPSNLIDPIAPAILKFMPSAGPYFLNGDGQLSNYVY